MERQYASSFTQTRAVWLSSGKPYANSLPSGVGRERERGSFFSLSLSPFFNLVKLTTFSQALISASLMGQRPTRELRGWEKNLERERERENGTEVGSLWGAFIYILEEVEFIASVSLFLGCGFQWSEQGRGHWNGGGEGGGGGASRRRLPNLWLLEAEHIGGRRKRTAWEASESLLSPSIRNNTLCRGEYAREKRMLGARARVSCDALMLWCKLHRYRTTLDSLCVSFWMSLS